jgi:hypothetical protein
MIIGRETPEEDRTSISNAVKGQAVYIHHSVNGKPTIWAHLSESEDGPHYVAILDSDDIVQLINTALSGGPMHTELKPKLRTDEPVMIRCCFPGCEKEALSRPHMIVPPGGWVWIGEDDPGGRWREGLYCREHGDQIEEMRGSHRNESLRSSATTKTAKIRD